MISREATPPLAMDIESPASDFESDDFFSKSYVPLSSFPTPPPSALSRKALSESIGTPMSLSDPNLVGASIHLSNLIPSAASLLDPSTEITNSLLVKAALPTESLALACCILDSLNSRFALLWRRNLPLESAPVSPKSSCPSVSSAPPSPFFQADWTPVSTSRIQEPHIDNIRPEVIILSALVIAHKFLDDQPATTGYYADVWADSRWSREMINATEQTIMANLNYRILPLCDEELLADAKEDMQRAGWFAKRDCAIAGVEEKLAGQAVWGVAHEVTPARTPPFEDCPRPVMLDGKLIECAVAGLGFSMSGIRV